MSAAELFDSIAKNSIRNLQGCELGKMMSSPGLKYKNKVFAFFWDDHMGFKLGKEYDIAAHGSKKWSYLSPFKTKPPMKAWYVLPKEEAHLWDELTNVAYSLLKKQLK